MVSINSGANAYVLSNLRQINSDISASQTRIGTGKKVNSASDNASVWSIAQTLRSEQKAQDGTSTGMSIAKARADVAVAALNSASTILGKMTELANSTTATNDPTGASAKFVALQTQLTAALTGASFQGENWLTGTVTASVTGNVTIGFSGSTVLKLDAGVVDQDAVAAYTALAAITTVVDNDDAETASNKNGASLAAAIALVATQFTAYQTTLSTFSSSLAIQQDFQKTLTGIRDSAISSMVDADLEEESAKVTALQVKQQLAYQALAITNSSSQNVLRLFQ